MKKVPFPLIEKPIGSITYEHTYVKNIYEDIYIGDAERNYYLDRYHEINLCVHYNVRIPGTFKFIPEYQYYLTNERMSRKLHWSLGIPEEKMIVEKYDSLEAAEESQYYKDFCDLKEKIDDEIKRQKGLDWSMLNTSMSSSSCRQYPSGESYYRITEMPSFNDGEFIQIHLDERSEEWKVSKSSCRVMTLWRYLKDFDEINEKELHLMEYIPMDNNELDESSPYFLFLQKVKEDYKRRRDIY